MELHRENIAVPQRQVLIPEAENPAGLAVVREPVEENFRGIAPAKSSWGSLTNFEGSTACWDLVSLTMNGCDFDVDVVPANDIVVCITIIYCQ